VLCRTWDFFLLILVKFFDFWGLLLRFSISNVTNLWLNGMYLPVKVKANYDLKRLIQLAKISIPLSLPGYINTSFVGATMNVIILAKCGQSDLGIYGFSAAFQQMALILNSSLSQVFVVKLSGKYGETECVKSCWQYVRMPMLLSLVFATVISIGLCIAVGPFIQMFLPKYTEAIPVVYVMALYIPLEALYLPMHVFRVGLCHKTNFFLTGIRLISCAAAFCFLPKTIVGLSCIPLIGVTGVLCAGYLLMCFGKYQGKE